MNPTILVTSLMNQGLDTALKMSPDDPRLPQIVQALSEVSYETFNRYLLADLRGASKDHRIKVVAQRLANYWQAVNLLTRNPADNSPAPQFFYEALETARIEHTALLENLALAANAFDSMSHA